MSEPIWIDHDDDPREEEWNVAGIEQLRPGDIGFTRLGGLAGPLVWLGQKIVDAASKEESRFQHVFVVTEAEGQDRLYRDPAKIVQAMPSGAEEIEIGTEHWTEEFLYIRPRYSPDAMLMADLVASRARAYVGTPYSFLDYVALAELHFGVANGWARRKVTSSKSMICSQLADQAMTDAGWHIFTDGRLSQDVIPSSLYRKMMTMPGQFIVGGSNVWQPTRR